MVIDIDNSHSVGTFVKRITENWFDVEKLYFDLKANSTTDTPKDNRRTTEGSGLHS